MEVSVWRKGERIWVPDSFLVLFLQDASLLGPVFEFQEMSLCPFSHLPLLLIYINKFKYFMLLNAEIYFFNNYVCLLGM